MSGPAIIEAKGLQKSYRRYRQPRDRLIEWLTLGAMRRHESFVALHAIDLRVARGECVGVIGENGAGKSTLLKLISGVAYPSAGTVATRGRVVSLLELGAGFNPDLDGRQNIFASARLLGYADDEIRARLDDIVAFAELGDFIHEPLKTYSSGMYVRLAFSLFAFLDPDVYIVDEALSVGDVFFQQKCFRFMESLKDRGVTVLLASHDMQAIARLADRVLLLEHGMAQACGDPMEAINMYYARHGPAPVAPAVEIAAPAGADGVPGDAVLSPAAVQSRWGRGAVRFVGARILDANGRRATCFDSGAQIRLQLWARATEDVGDLTFGFQILDRMNTALFGQTLYQRDRTVLQAREGELFEVEFRLPFRFGDGTYVIQLSAADCGVDAATDIYDFVERGLIVEVAKPAERTWHGVVAVATEADVRRL